MVDFVVVGAGLSGLIAARDMVSAGASVLIFEARDRVGGRLLSRDIGEDVTIDLGGQWMGPFHDRLGHAASALGLDTYPTFTGGVSTLSLGTQRFGLQRLIPDLPSLCRLDILQVALRFSRMVSKVPVETPWTTPQGVDWDRITASSWIQRSAFNQTTRRFLRAAVEASFGFEPEETSLLGLLFDVKAARSLRDLWGAQARSFTHGAQSISSRLAEQLGDRIILGHPVVHIAQDPNGVVVTAGDRHVRARATAVCIPPAVVPRIDFEPELPLARRKLVAGLPPGNVIKALAIYDEPFWRAEGHSGQTLNTDLLVRVTYDATPPWCSAGILLALSVASGAQRLREVAISQRRDRILCDLATLFGPKARRIEQLHVLDWSQEVWTGGCYAAHFSPEIWTTVGSCLRQPNGRIHWAGTETAADWHGYMEGAVRAGERVAAELLADL